jgi:GTPase SAR1 family protein
MMAGNQGVGKTAIYSRYLNETFSEEGQSTIGVDFSFKDL